MGWTLEELLELPVEYYDALMADLIEQAAKRRAEDGGDGVDIDMDAVIEARERERAKQRA